MVYVLVLHLRASTDTAPTVGAEPQAALMKAKNVLKKSSGEGIKIDGAQVRSHNKKPRVAEQQQQVGGTVTAPIAAGASPSVSTAGKSTNTTSWRVKS